MEDNELTALAEAVGVLHQRNEKISVQDIAGITITFIGGIIMLIGCPLLFGSVYA